MPTFKVTYFDARGFAELSRLLLAYNGAEWEDERVTMDQWKGGMRKVSGDR